MTIIEFYKNLAAKNDFRREKWSKQMYYGPETRVVTKTAYFVPIIFKIILFTLN